MSKIDLRTGCFCNTGDCQKHLGLTSDEMLSNFNAGHVCGDQMDIIDGKPTGSVRISFGHMSSFEDAWTFLQFIQDCFLISCDNYVNNPSYLLNVENSSDTQSSLNGSEFDAKAKKSQEICHNDSSIGLSHPDSHISLNGSELHYPNGKSGTSIPEANGWLGLTNEKHHDSVNFANRGQYELKQLLIYPVKSCAPFEVRYTVDGFIFIVLN